jgi:hypothetical protein
VFLMVVLVFVGLCLCEVRLVFMEYIQLAGVVGCVRVDN